MDANLAGTGWRAIFLVNVPVCLAVLAAARRCLPTDRERVPAGLDLRGVGLLAGSVLLVVLPLVVAQQQGWPTWAWICLAASVPGGWLFLTAERRAAAAVRPVLVDLAAVRPAPVALGLIALAAATSTYYALLFTLAQYEQRGLGRSPVASGLILVPWVVAFGQAGQLAPRVPARMARGLPAADCALLTLAYSAISLSLFGGGHSELLLLVLLAAGGFGLGLQFATLIGHIMNAVEARFAADISGVTSTLSQLGGAFGVAGIGSLYLAIARGGGPARATHSAAIAIAAMAAVSFVAALAAYLATRPEARESPAGEKRPPSVRDERDLLPERNVVLPGGQGAPRTARCVPVGRQRGSAQQVGDRGNGRLDRSLGGVAEAHHQQGRRRWVGRAPVLRHPVQADAALAGGRDHGRLPRLGGQLGDRVEPGREPGQPYARRVPGERRDQRLAAGAVDGAHPPQVPVVAAGGEQRRQRHLVQRAGTAVAHLFLGRDRAGQFGRASTQPRRTAGASALLAVPIRKTRSDARPCSAPTGSLS